MRGGKKKFPWALQISIRSAELVGSAVWDAKLLRLYSDENHGNMHDACFLHLKTQSVPAPRSAPPVAVSDVCSVAAGPKLRSHVWWSVSCCQSGISLQGIGYCNRGALSGWTESELLVNRKAPKPSGEWETHYSSVFYGVQLQGLDILKGETDRQAADCWLT